MIKKIAVFDFDGTLVDTPTPEKGKPIFLEKTGKDWPHQGWWGRGETLDTAIFEMETIAEVIADFKFARASADTLVVMLTGRMRKLSEQVEIILSQKELHFDRHYYNGGGKDTLVHKLDTLTKLVIEHPEAEELHMWDDRAQHVASFQAWGQELLDSGRLKKFQFTIIDGSHHKAQ